MAGNHQHEIFIENVTKVQRCPSCGSAFSFENGTEILFRNILLVHINKETGIRTAKCRQCKALVKEKQSA